MKKNAKKKAKYVIRQQEKKMESIEGELNMKRERDEKEQ